MCTAHLTMVGRICWRLCASAPLVHQLAPVAKCAVVADAATATATKTVVCEKRVRDGHVRQSVPMSMRAMLATVTAIAMGRFCKSKGVCATGVAWVHVVIAMVAAPVRSTCKCERVCARGGPCEGPRDSD